MNSTRLFLLSLALLALVSPMFAQEAGAAGAGQINWVKVASVFAMAIASAEGLARNPVAAGSIRFALILGLALIESLALYTLVIILL